MAFTCIQFDGVILLQTRRGKVMANLEQVFFERSHFPWNSSLQVFQSCLSNIFSCELCCPRGTLTHVIVSHYKKTPFSRSSIQVPATLGQIQNATTEEGRDEKKECNVTVGTPPLNVSWKNVKTGQVTKGKLLTIINIRRNQSGEYRCIANSSCGNESTGMFIDMHCKNLCKVFTRLSDVYYSMLVSVFYNCVLNHIAVISMLLSSQSYYYNVTLVRVKYPF